MDITGIRNYLNLEANFDEGEFDILAYDKGWRKLLAKEGLIDISKFSIDYEDVDDVLPKEPGDDSHYVPCLQYEENQ